MIDILWLLFVVLLYDIALNLLTSFCPFLLHVINSQIFAGAFRDTPRKRGGAPTGSNLIAEPQLEESSDENFPVSKSVCVDSAFLNTFEIEKKIFIFFSFPQ